MKIIHVIFFLCTLCTTLLGASFKDDFAVVFIDASSEAKYGTFPLDREFLAKAIRRAGELHARGVVLKFFLDQPKTEASDLALAQSLTNLPVILQARIDDAEAHPNPLPERFKLLNVKAKTEVSGQSGWIPTPGLIAKSHDVGFVDFSTTQVPLLETYQDSSVKSLVLCCIELATGTQAVIQPGQKVTFGTHDLRVDSHNCVQAPLPLKDDLAYIPFHRFLTGDLPENLIRGKVVIIG
ncbi:MAG TPA: CHASE2 domain-containing protein, partial [Verrucomicrobiae bacterium]